MANRSFKFKVTTALFVFMLALGVGLPVVVNLIQGKVVQSYEQKSLEDQGQVFSSYLNSYVDSLAGRVATWLSTSAIEPLNEEPINVEGFENRLLGIGNGVAASHAVTRIQVYDLENAKRIDYSTMEKSLTFKTRQDSVKELVGQAIEAEGKVSQQVVADNGKPFIALAVPSEDDDEEVNFIHVYFLGLEPLLAEFANVNGYPTSFKSGEYRVYADSNVKQVKEFEKYSDAVFKNGEKFWRKRKINIQNKMITTPSAIDVYVDVTKLHQEFAEIDKMTNAGLAVVCILFFATFYGLLSYLMRPLGSIISNLSSVSSHVQEKSRTMASSTEVAMKNVDDQLGAVTSTVSAADEINAMLNRTRELGGQTRQLSEESKGSAEGGLRSVRDMIDGVERLEQVNQSMFNTVLEGNKKIADLTKIVEQIGEKTEVINTITFQTKLLSFNASVEAARAGEHGKGFAVVAEEVGSLAKMSADAAKEINDIVSQSISQVNKTLTHIESESKETIKSSEFEISEVSRKGKDCGEGLKAVVENFEQVDMRVNDLSMALDEQTEAVRSIADAMNDIQGTAQSNQQSSRSNNVAARELDGEAQQITKSVGNLTMMFLGSGGLSEHSSLGTKVLKFAKKPLFKKSA